MTNAFDQLRTTRVIPVLVIENENDALAIGEALAAGGLPVIEVTLRTTAGLPAISALSSTNTMLVGAGTVCAVTEVDAAVEAGASFIVSPGLRVEVVQRCQELGVACLPGVATATELMAAQALGLKVVKFFPAEALGGLTTLRSLAAPFPDMRFVPSGGITAESAPTYLDDPAVLAVAGGWMLPRETIALRRFADISAMAAQVVRDTAHVQP